MPTALLNISGNAKFCTRAFIFSNSELFVPVKLLNSPPKLLIMSNVGLYIMRNCTLRNITAALSVACALLMGEATAFAQTVYKAIYTGDGSEISEGRNELNSEGAMCDYMYPKVIISENSKCFKPVPGYNAPTDLEGYRVPQSIYLYLVTKNPNGTEILEGLDTITPNNAIDGISPHGYISNQTSNGVGILRYDTRTQGQKFGTNINNGSRLQRLMAVPNYVANFSVTDKNNQVKHFSYTTESLQGRTLLARIFFGTTLTGRSTTQVDFYFDMIGGKFPSITDIHDLSPTNLGDDYWAYFMPCPGSGPVEMKISGVEYPYLPSDQESYLGNKYSVKYTWKRITVSDDWEAAMPKGQYVTDRNGDNKSFTDSVVANQTSSGMVEYSPVAVIYRNGVNTGCEVETSTLYDIFLYQPLEAYNGFKNLTSGATSSESGSETVNKFYACYGDDVEYKPLFKQQEIDAQEAEELDDNVYWAIYKLDNKGNIAETLQDFQDYKGGDSFTFANLTESATYKVVAEYYDPGDLNNGSRHRNGEISEHPCPTEKIFSIEVRQVSATTHLKFPDENVCEESDAEISATVANLPAGDKPSEYAYRWFYSDDAGSTYNDLNTTDWLHSNDADWVDPTTTVKTTMKNVVFPIKSNGLKYVKFLLANTYKVKGTTYYCEIPTEDKFQVYFRPVLNNPDDVIACQDQPVSFQVKIDDWTATPDVPSLGMTYNVYKDTINFESARDVVSPLYGDADGNRRNDGIAAPTYNENRLGTTGEFMWWVVQHANPANGTGVYKFYTTVKNEQTTCVSHPVETKIHVLPLPEVTSVIPDPASYCLNSDPKDLIVKSVLNTNYDSFDYSQAGVAKPEVSYHWNWFYPSGAPIDSAIVNSDVLSGMFADRRVTLYAGNVLFSVYATDNQRCGYELNYDGTVKQTQSGYQNPALKPATGVLKVNPKPDFSIELPDNVVCGNAGSVSIPLKSNDGRSVKFTITPKSGTKILSSNSPVTVSGYSTANFIVNYDEADVDDDQLFEFEYSAVDIDNTEQNCDSISEFAFVVNERPQLKALVDPVLVCYGQASSFNVEFAGNIPVPTEGLSYILTSDMAGANRVGKISCGAAGTKTQSTNVTFLIDSDYFTNPAGGSSTIYAFVIDEKTKCISDAQPVVLISLPQPIVDNITFSQDAFCRNDDASQLVVKANFSNFYTSFNYTGLGLLEPQITCNWSWTDGLGKEIGSETVAQSNVLTNSFAGLTSEVSHKIAGSKHPLFKVNVSDNHGCGFVLDNTGAIIVGPLQTAEASLTVNPLPYPYIENDVKVCAVDGEAVVHIGSNDSRALALTFTPQSADAPDATTSLNVAANSKSSEFVANIDEDKISDITTFVYNVHASDYYPSCGMDTTLSFTVYPSPVLKISPADSLRHVCQGSAIALGVEPTIKDNGKVGPAANYSYSWSVDGAVIASSKNCDWTVPVNATVGNHTVEVSVTYRFADGHECTKSQSINVFVNPTPVVTFSVDRATICEGEAATLTATVTNGYDPNNYGTNNTFTPSVSPVAAGNKLYDFVWEFSVNPAKTTTYSLSVKNDVTGCVVPSESQVVVNVDRKAHFRVTGLSSTELCAGNHDIEVSISAVNPTEFTSVDWSTLVADGFTVVSASDSKIVINGTLDEGDVNIGKSIFSAKTAPGCDVVFDNDLVVKVRPIPEAPVVVYVTSTNSKEWVCKGQNQQISYKVANPQQGLTYEWFVSETEPAVNAVPDPGNTKPASNTTFTVNTSTLTKDTYVWVRAIGSRYTTKCPSMFASYLLKVQPVPAPSFSVDDVCEDESGVIEITSPLADADHTYTYNFYEYNNTKTPAQSGSSNKFTTPNLKNSTLYFFSVSQNETGCASSNLQVKVVVNKKPVGHTSVSYYDAAGNSDIIDPFGNSIPRSAFCEGEQGSAVITLTPTMQTPGTDFTSTLVSVSSGSITDWVKNSENKWSCLNTHVWNEDCTLTFSVTDQSTKCESENFTATVTVKPGLPAPTIKINDEAKEVCYDVETPIKLTLASSYNYASSSVAFAYYMADAKTGDVLAGPISSLDGSFSSSIKSLGIKDDVVFYAYAYDSKSGCMSPVSNSVGIKVNPLPIPTISVSADKLCPDESVTLKVNETFDSYHWLDGETQGQTTQSVTVTLKSSAKFRVRVTDSNGCVSLPVEASVTVFPRPAFHLEADPVSVCQGSNDDVIIKVIPENDLNSSAVEKVEFENSYTFVTVPPSTGVVTSRLNAAGETEYVVSHHTWTEASESFTATIRSTSDYNSCLSDVKTVTVYVVSALPKPEALAPSPQTGTLTNDIHVCDNSEQKLTVSVVNTAAYPTAGNVKYTYHWFSDAAGLNELTDGAVYSVDYSAGTITFVPSQSMTLYVKAFRETEPNCSSELSDVVSITIEPLPSAPVAADPSPKYVCQPEMAGSNVALSIHNPATDNIYHWYTAADDKEIGTANGTDPFIVTAPTVTTEYYARTESRYGCLSDDISNIVVIEVNGNPVIKTVASPEADICSGESVSMTVGVEGDKAGITYEYEITSSNPFSALVGKGSVDNNGVLTIPQLDVTDTESLTLTFKAVYAGVCYSQNSVVFNVTVHGIPTVDGIVASPNPLCEGEDLNIDVANVVSHDGSATLADVRVVDAQGNTLISQKDVASGSYLQFVLNRTVLPNGVVRSLLPLSVEVEDANCTLKRQVALVLNDIPEFEIESKIGGVDVDGKINFCRNDTLLLGLVKPLPSADSQGNELKYTYEWRKDDMPLGETNSEYMQINITPSESGVYTLVVTSWRGINKACEFSRSLDVLVNELPTAFIDGERINGFYCTDGDLDIFGNPDMSRYEWIVDVVPSDSLVKTDGDNHLVKSLSELNVTTDGNFVVRLKVTDQNGCQSLEESANIFTAVPPVISAINGVEACTDKPFVITVEQDRADYEFKLYESDGVTEVADCVYDASVPSITTSTDLPEGEYVIRVTDVDSECSTDSLITLKRYDIEPVFKLIPDSLNRFYCYNGTVAFDISLEENNGHADFFERIEDVKISLDYSFRNTIVHADAPVTIADNKLHVEFQPNDPLYNFLPSNEPYTVTANVTYKFKTDVNDVLSCDNSRDQNLRIVEVPVIETDPLLPVCLGQDIRFIVRTDNIDVTPGAEKYMFFVNGVQVVNVDGDYSSNEFYTADHPEITLDEGDVVTAEVVMDQRGNMCTSEPVVVTYKGDFKPVIANVNTSDELCLGSDITFDIESRMPANVADPATFVLRKIKSYDLFLIDSKGVKQYGTSVDISDAMALVTSGKFLYDGDDTSVRFFAKVTDEDDCEFSTDTVTVKINQFKIKDVIVTNMNGDVMNTDDLCADIDYSYKAVLVDGDGQVITPGSNYDFTFTFDGVEWSDHSAGFYLVDSVVGSHAVTDGYIDMVVNVINLVTGCKTDLVLNLYKPYTESFKFHAKPDPQEKLNEPYLPVSDDPADARKFEICHDDDFSFSMNGSIVTVVYDGVPEARYVNGALDESLGNTMLDRINASYDSATGVSGFTFHIDPSADFHDIYFVVSDGTCEVSTDIWQFRKYEEIKVSAVDFGGVEYNNNGVVTLCRDQVVDFNPSTAEPNYTSGYKFYLDGVLVSPDDFSSSSYNFVADTVGTFELEVKPDFGSNGCSTKLQIVVKEAPIPSVEIEGLTAANVGYDWTFSFCENQDLKLNLDGAEQYQISDLTIDGVPHNADEFFATIGQGQPFGQVINLQSFNGANGFSTYKFNVTYKVGNCDKLGTVTLLVYNNPEAEFINGTPKKLIISGEEVPVEVTSGFTNYEFIVNGNSLQSGASNLLNGADNKIVETSTIEVIVTNDFGCDTTLVAVVNVLDGIKPKTITSSSDYYCSEEPGVRITVVDPQPGVTYQLVNTGATIKAEEGSDVYWEPVRLKDPLLVNPEKFAVIAYYDQLPDQQFDMSNTVSVEEVKSPADAILNDLVATNCQIVQSPTFVWSVSGADVNNYYWLVAPDDSEFGPINPTSSSFDIPVYDILMNAYGATPNGVYHVVARSQRKFGPQADEYVCDKVLAGTLKIDIPTTEAFEVKMNPVNGNVCVSDLQGVDIFLEHSDYDPDYEHVYVLYQDGVEVARQTSQADGGEIRFKNVNVNAAGNYTFSVVCLFNGCSQAMLNTVTLNVFDPPADQTLMVDNDGYFCYDANGATITVGGQQEGYLYKLFRNGYDSWTSTDASGAQVTVEFSHVGDASGDPFSFSGVKEAGTYTVKVFIPALDRYETSCVTEISGSVEVHPTPEPVLPDAHIAKGASPTVGSNSLEVCADEAVRITILQPESWSLPDFEVHYRVYDETGALVTEDEIQNLGNSDRVVFEDFTPQGIALAAGVHRLTVIATQTRNLTDGTKLECSKDFADILTLYVKNRPSDGTEFITVDTKPANPLNDPCYGVDLVINNANTGVADSVEYKLFLIDKLSGNASYVGSVMPYDGDEPRFKDIRNGNGDYFVVAYNGACSDTILPKPVHVEVDKYAVVQTLDVEDFMCQGDAGVSAGLIDSEENVIYRLFYVAPSDWTRDFTQQELIDLHPGVMISEFNKATFDHQRVTFIGVNYQDGTPVSDLINRDGYYYVVCIKDVADACPVASPAVNFQSLKLPKSFNLMDNRFYCDGKGVQLYVEHSELDPNAVITYKLYQKDAAGNLTYVSEVVSDGSDMLFFKNGQQELFVKEGTYAAIALKEYSIEVNGQIKHHICTSALATEVEVKEAEPLDNLAFPAESLLVCSNGDAEFTLPASSLKSGISYFVTDDQTSPETAYSQSSTYTGSGDVSFTRIFDGVNVVWASYPNFDCLVEIGRVDVTRHPVIPQNFSDFICGESDLELNISDTKFLIDGLTYWLVDEIGNVVSPVEYHAPDAGITFSGLNPQSYTLWGAFGGVNGDCETQIGDVEAINPEAEAKLFVNGDEYSSGETVEMCPGLYTMATINAKNANVTRYKFTMSVDGGPEQVGYEGSNSAWTLTSDIKSLQGSTIELHFYIETVCGEFRLDDVFTITLKGVGSMEQHLKATNDAIYCEGVPAVKLYYDDAKQGELYRLYKVSSDGVVDPGEDPDNKVYNDDLMDIQEIPRGVTNPSNILYFNGWGHFDGENGQLSQDFATSGCYYVETSEANTGCAYLSDTVCVQVVDPIISKSDSAFYAYQDMDGVIDESTINTDFGYLGGVLALRNPKPGVKYYLLKDDRELSYMTIDKTTSPADTTFNEIFKVAEPGDRYLVFGPFKEMNEDGNVYWTNDTVYAGDGVYSIKAVDQCESVSNPVTFVGEELVAYNVEIYLNKNEVSRIIDLIPTYNFTTHTSYKTNRKYIGWSSKVDRIYRPKVVTGDDGFFESDVNETLLINKDEDERYFLDGYTNVKGDYVENVKAGKISYTGKPNASNVWFNIVQDPTVKISGSYGFVNVDYTPSDTSHISMRTPTGYFFYMKQPSYYGQEKIRYYVENYQMPERRSNIATITILCGNEETGDTTSVFLIPNAFSPNGDGLNDYFKIIIPDKYQDNSESKLMVFNRWGTLVYRSSGLRYGEDDNWWDGTSSTSNMVTLGEKLPSGTYYYVFTISFIDKTHAVKSERKMHGYVELRR